MSSPRNVFSVADDGNEIRRTEEAADPHLTAGLNKAAGGKSKQLLDLIDGWLRPCGGTSESGDGNTELSGNEPTR